MRAGLVDDPKDYRWCGYAEAVAGSKIARAGLLEVFGDRGTVSWKQIARDYRKLLFSAGEQRKPEKNQQVRRGIHPERVKEVLEGNGELSLGELVRCRVRYFADGLAFGSADFVEEVFRNHRKYFGRNRKDGARRLAGGEYAGLRTLRDLRRQPLC